MVNKPVEADVVREKMREDLSINCDNFQKQTVAQFRKTQKLHVGLVYFCNYRTLAQQGVPDISASQHRPLHRETHVTLTSRPII